MEKVFLSILNLSIIASYLILAVLLLRLIFRKIPRKLTCVLWALVGIRLAIPFSFESILSLIPSAQTFDPEIIYSPAPVIKSGIPMIDATVNPVISENLTPITSESVPPMVTVTEIASIIWCVGLTLILIYGIVSYLLVRRRVVGAVLLEDNIWQSEGAPTPFILGIIKPKIYIPFNIDGDSREYVIAHEKAHLKRLDHLIKPVGFILLAVYWFNPLVWIAYILLCRDIELACDEKVIRNMDEDSRRAYASALLSCSAGRRRLAACPLAFGEVGVKERVKGVMNYKKPAFWIILVALILCVCTAVFFLTSPKDDIPPEQEKTVFGANSFERSTLIGAGSTYGVDIPVIVDDISVRSGTPRIDITLKNNSGMTLSHGSPYSIYYISDGEKTDCDHFAAERVWTSIAHMVMPGGTKEMGFTMDSHDLSKAGRYRFELEFWLGDDHETKYTAWAEFEIAEDLPAIKVSAKEYEGTAADPVFEGEQYFKIIHSTTAALSDFPRDLSFDIAVTGENTVEIVLAEQMDINGTVTQEFELKPGESQTVLTTESGGGAEYVFEITKMPESEMDGSDAPGYFKRLSDIPTYEETVDAGVLDETHIYAHYIDDSAKVYEEFANEANERNAESEIPCFTIDSYEDFSQVSKAFMKNNEGLIGQISEKLFEDNMLVVISKKVGSTGWDIKVDEVLISGENCNIILDSKMGPGNFVVVARFAFVVIDRDIVKNCTKFNTVTGVTVPIADGEEHTKNYGDIIFTQFSVESAREGINFNDADLWKLSESPTVCDITQSPLLYKIDNGDEMETLKKSLSKYFNVEEKLTSAGFVYNSFADITDFSNLHYREYTVFVIIEPNVNLGTRHFLDSIKTENGNFSIIFNSITGTEYMGTDNRFMVVSIPKKQTDSFDDFIAKCSYRIGNSVKFYGTEDDYIAICNETSSLIFNDITKGCEEYYYTIKDGKITFRKTMSDEIFATYTVEEGEPYSIEGDLAAFYDDTKRYEYFYTNNMVG